MSRLLESIRQGIASDPMYVSEQLQWLTDEGKFHLCFTHGGVIHQGSALIDSFVCTSILTKTWFRHLDIINYINFLLCF